MFRDKVIIEMRTSSEFLKNLKILKSKKSDHYNELIPSVFVQIVLHFVFQSLQNPLTFKLPFIDQRMQNLVF